jgi:hypothetical protein
MVSETMAVSETGKMAQSFVKGMLQRMGKDGIY